MGPTSRASLCGSLPTGLPLSPPLSCVACALAMHRPPPAVLGRCRRPSTTLPDARSARAPPSFDRTPDPPTSPCQHATYKGHRAPRSPLFPPPPMGSRSTPTHPLPLLLVRSTVGLCPKAHRILAEATPPRPSSVSATASSNLIAFAMSHPSSPSMDAT
jgi:hypothetical protein